MSYTKYTSFQTLDTISRHCPEALHTYLLVILRIDKEGHATFTKKFIKDDLCETWTKFVNNLKKLYIEGLLEFHILDSHIRITLAHENVEEDDED